MTSAIIINAMNNLAHQASTAVQFLDERSHRNRARVAWGALFPEAKNTRKAGNAVMKMVD